MKRTLIAAAILLAAANAYADTVASVYYAPDPRAKQNLLALIANAKTSIILSNPFFTDPDFGNALAVASTNGITVSAVLAQSQTRSSDEWQYQTLADPPNVAIWLSPMHQTIPNNFMILDGGTTCLGSYRWSPTAVQNGNWSATITGSNTANAYLETWQALQYSATPSTPVANPLAGQTTLTNAYTSTTTWDARQVTATSNGTATTAYLAYPGTNTVSPTCTWTIGIYSDTGGSPATLLATTNTTAFSGPNLPIIATFATPYVITSGTTYWLAWQTNAPNITTQYGSIATQNWAKSQSAPYTPGSLPATPVTGEQRPAFQTYAAGIAIYGNQYAEHAAKHAANATPPPIRKLGSLPGPFIIGNPQTTSPLNNQPQWIAQKYTATATAPLTAMGVNSAYTSTPSGTQTWTLGVYADSAGTPGSLIATSGTNNLLSEYEPVITTFQTPPTLTAGTNYWLALQSSNTGLYGSLTGGTQTYYYSNSYPYNPGTLPAFSSSSSTLGGTNRNYGIWGITTTTPAPTNITATFAPGTDCQSAAIALITSATATVYLEAYSFTNEPIETALSAAISRGVKVYAILDKSNTSSTYSLGRLLQVQGARSTPTTPTRSSTTRSSSLTAAPSQQEASTGAARRTATPKTSYSSPPRHSPLSTNKTGTAMPPYHYPTHRPPGPATRYWQRRARTARTEYAQSNPPFQHRAPMTKAEMLSWFPPCPCKQCRGRPLLSSLVGLSSTPD